MSLSSSIFSIHVQESSVALIKPYVKTPQNGCDLDLCFKSIRCLLPSECYHTKVLRILSCLFYSSATMSAQSLSVKRVGLIRRFRRVAQRAVGWAKSLCVHMGTSALLVWSYLSDMFCHVECWSLWVRGWIHAWLPLVLLTCTTVVWNSPMLEYKGETRQKHQLGKHRSKLVAVVLENLF